MVVIGGDIMLVLGWLKRTGEESHGSFYPLPKWCRVDGWEEEMEPQGLPTGAGCRISEAEDASESLGQLS